MIKFFRKIRQNLLLEGKTSNYLKYAIGEIVLVMVGILLALQVNNWNEWRKDRKIEKQILYEIKINIEENRNPILYSKEFTESAIESCNKLVNIVNSQNNYSEDMNSHFIKAFLFFQPTLSYSAYESLKNTGLNIILSNSLRNRIVTLYDMEYQHFSSLMERIRIEDVKPILIPFIVANFRVFKDSSGNLSYKPNDIQQLIKSQEFSNIISFLKSYHEDYLNIQNETLDSADEVLDLIKVEIEK